MNPSVSNDSNRCDFPHQIKDMWDIWEETQTEINFGNITASSIITGDVKTTMPNPAEYLNNDDGLQRNLKIAALVVYGCTLKEVAVACGITPPRIREIIRKVIQKYVSELRKASLSRLRYNKIYVLKALLNN